MIILYSLYSFHQKLSQFNHSFILVFILFQTFLYFDIIITLFFDSNDSTIDYHFINL